MNHRARGELVRALELLELLGPYATDTSVNRDLIRAWHVAKEDADRAARDYAADASTDPQSPVALLKDPA